MNGNQLLEEGRRLARPCVYLRTQGRDYAGIWGGSGPVPTPKLGYQHWISVDRRLVPGQEHSQGWISLFLDDTNTTGMIVESSPGALPEHTDGTKLYAELSRSLPPLDAIFRFGSAEVHRWLAELGWSPDSGYNDNFKGKEVARSYEKIYQNELPLYSGGAHAVIGGWHLPWPDGDWDELVDKSLVLWTFEDSEPWVEVWQEESGFRVIPRIT